MYDRIQIFTLRTLRAWRYYRLLDYPWRVAWAKAGWACGLQR